MRYGTKNRQEQTLYNQNNSRNRCVIMLMSNFWNMFFRNRVSYGALPCPEIPVF